MSHDRITLTSILYTTSTTISLDAMLTFHRFIVLSPLNGEDKARRMEVEQTIEQNNRERSMPKTGGTPSQQRLGAVVLSSDLEVYRAIPRAQVFVGVMRSGKNRGQVAMASHIGESAEIVVE